MRNRSNEQINWKRIETFVGYGKIDAPVVFIGIEEGLSNRRALRKDLTRRSQFKSVMDLKRAHEGIANCSRFFDAVNPKSQRTWRPMCHLMLPRTQGEHAPNNSRRKTYQSLHLGRTHGQTLLTELLPYPHSHTRHWLYRRLGRCYPDRKSYEKALLPKRLALLSRTLARHRPDIIVCYGKTRWTDYKRLVSQAYGEVKWVAHEPLLAEKAIVGKTRILLVHHFSRGPFSSESELAAFVKLAKT
jgi:hypothetical protein